MTTLRLAAWSLLVLVPVAGVGAGAGALVGSAAAQGRPAAEPARPARGRPATAAALAVPIVPATRGTPLVPRGVPWRIAPDAPSALTTGWRDRGFDDARWTWGRPRLTRLPAGHGGHAAGAERDAGGTATAPASSPTGKFRRKVLVTDREAFAAYVLRLHRGDVTAVWLNGHELARDPAFPANAPAAPAPTPARAPAAPAAHRPAAPAPPPPAHKPAPGPQLSPGQPGTPPTFTATVHVPTELLVEGENVLAVEMRRRMSEEAAFDLELVGVHAPSITRGPYLQVGTQTSAVVRFRTDVPVKGRVAIGRRAGAPEKIFEEETATTEHEIALVGLRPDTRYLYAVGAEGRGRLHWLAGGDDVYAFQTAPARPKPTRVWVLGDSGTKDDRAAAVRDAYVAYAGERATDVWLMLGDNAYDKGLDHEYQAAVFDMYPRFLASNVLWSAVGNHETNGRHDVKGVEAAPYFKMFTFPTRGEAGGVPSGTERFYSFDYGDVHFIALDSMTTSTERDPTKRSYPAAMLDWLRSDLEANRKPWTIAFFHHPPYTKGTHDSDHPTGDYESFLVRRQLLPLLESHGVDLVLAGHSHVYERSFLLAGHHGTSKTFAASMKRDAGDGRPGGDGAYVKRSREGAVYVVAGSSGQTSRSVKLDHPAMLVSFPRTGSLVLDVDGGRLDAKFLRENGFVDDHFTIQKGEKEKPLPKLVLASPEPESTIAAGGRLRVAVAVPEATRLARVDVYRSPHVLLGSDREPPFELDLPAPPPGVHQLTAVGITRDGAEVMALPTTIEVKGEVAVKAP